MAETEDLLKRQRQELDARIKELYPCVGEYELLTAALDALNDAGTTTSTQETKTTKRRSRSTPSSKGSGNGQRGRPPGSGKRKDQLLDIITRNPGVTIAEATTVMAMASNYGYKLRDQLLEDGSIEYEGQGFKPTGKSPVQEEPSEPAQEQGELAEEPIGEQPSEETAEETEQAEEPIQEQTTEPAEAVESTS